MPRYTASWFIIWSWYLWQCCYGARWIWCWKRHIWTSCELALYFSSAWVFKLLFFFPLWVDAYLLVAFWMLQCKQLTFKDINGLVQQNAQLRSLVRNLSDQLESRENEFKVGLKFSTSLINSLWSFCFRLVRLCFWKLFDVLCISVYPGTPGKVWHGAQEAYWGSCF